MKTRLEILAAILTIVASIVAVVVSLVFKNSSQPATSATPQVQQNVQQFPQPLLDQQQKTQREPTVSETLPAPHTSATASRPSKHHRVATVRRHIESEQYAEIPAPADSPSDAAVQENVGGPSKKLDVSGFGNSKFERLIKEVN